LKVGGGAFSSFELRTPIDDENTLYFWYVWYELPDQFADVIAQIKRLDNVYNVPLQRADGSFLMDTIDSQDAMVWVTQGRRSSRQDEHLVQGDEGVALWRKLVGEQIDTVAVGGDPLAVLRTDPGPIELPMESSHRGIGGRYTNPLAEFLRRHAKYSRRVPEAVRLIDEKLGLDPEPLMLGV
jgi:5,5'-dehydrodivanillate O-demethylase